MNTSYRRLIAWSAAATIVVLALSAGIAAAEEPAEPVECVSNATTNDVVCSYPPPTTTTEPQWSPPDLAYTDPTYDQCLTYVAAYRLTPASCEPYFVEECLRWFAAYFTIPAECEQYRAGLVAEIGEPQVIDTPGVLPKTGNGSTVALIAALCVALGALCLVVRGIGRDMDDDWGAL